MEQITLFLKELIQASDLGNWVASFSLIIVFTIVLQFAWRVFSNKMETIIKKTSNVWDDIFWFSISRPVNWLILFIGGSIGLLVIATSEKLFFYEYLPLVQKLAILLLIGWAFIRLVNKAELVFSSNENKDPTTIAAVAKLSKLSILTIIALSAIQTLGVSISGLLAFGGMGGLVIGMAAKDLLGNIFGALMIYLDKPFKVGDWIRSPDKSIEGTVEKIGWRVTQIRTFDKRPLYIPNGLFTQIIVENASRMSNRRIKETFGIRYCDLSKMDLIIADVKGMLKAHNEIDQNQTMIVNFDSFNSSSLDFFIYTFTKTTNWIVFHEVKQDVLLQVANIVDAHKAEFAFPTRQLNFETPILEQIS